MFLDYHQIKELDQKFGSSFYLLDVNKLRKTIKKLRMHLRVDMKTLLSVIPIKQIIFHIYVRNYRS